MKKENGFKKEQRGNGVSKRVFGVLAFSLGVLFVAIGLQRGEMQAVFAKASIVCLQCIGIG